MEWKEFENKRIFCKSQQGVYSGVFLKFNDPFIIMIDKFGDKILINKSEILKLVKENNAQNQKTELTTKVNNYPQETS